MAYINQIKLSDTTYDISAIKLKNARTISLTGAITGSVNFDGSNNVSINTITNHNHDTLYTKKQSWETTAGGSYVGWIKLIEWTPSTAGHFGLRPILFSLHRRYNSPDPECYLLSLSVSWDSKASINLLQGIGTRIIKNFRFTRNADKTKYWFEMYVDETYTTYTNICSCSIFGYESFTGTLLSNTLQTETVTSLKSIETVNNGIVADNFIGNASTATKLKNARTIRTNLASTTAASFDGSTNITPGVTGVLGVANGGTGASDHVANRLVWSESANKIRASYHYANSTKVAINSTSEPSTNFYVNGTSSFNGDVSLDVNDSDRYLTFGYTGSTGYDWRIGYLGSGSGEANYLVFQSSKTDGVYSNALRFGLTSLDAAFGGNVYPLTNNTKTLGTSSLKWSNVYATTFTGALVGNASTATNVAWNGVTGKPSYYDAKAIKSITRSGTTFTYTCMDDSTGTFTQQDNNTDTKVTQGRSEASNYRSLLLHYVNTNYGTNPGTSTNQVYYNETIAACPQSGDIKATSFTGALKGNAATASRLATARTISLTGSVTGSGSFDGSGNLSIATTTNHNHDSAYVKKTGDTMTGNFLISNANLYIIKNGRTVCHNIDTSPNSLWLNWKDDNNFTQLALLNESYGSGHLAHLYRKVNGGAIEDYNILHSGNYSFYAAPVSHSHTISQVTWPAAQNLICTGDSSEWSIDMDSSAPNSYFHIWSGYLGNSCMKFENNTGLCRAPYGVYGGVWNDYAEFRICNDDFKPGQVIVENGDDTLSIASQRLQRGCSIISDTFGFAIGETDKAKCPIAVSGRVLAYGYESREEFKTHIGWPVCSGPNGTVSIMTEEEEEKYPSRIIGTISAVPDYETWGTGNVEVNNRIWIKIK